MRILVLILTLAFGALALPSLADAQPAPSAPGAVVVQRADKGGAQVSVAPRYPHKDRVESGGKGMALMFWLFAAGTIGGSLFVITRKNWFGAGSGLVGSFLGIAAVYRMLYAHFLAIIQMLVYAGAIMVLFVFVVMILNRPEDEPVAPSGRAGQAIGAVAILYLVYRLAMLLIHVRMPNANVALNAPLPVSLPPLRPGATGELVDWGSTKAVGADLFGPGIFPFEAISILLLIAVVGAIAIARPVSDDPHAGEAPDAGGAP